MSDYWELAAHVVGMDPDDAYDKTDEIEERLDERWGIDLATFEHVADTLLRYTPSLTSPLSDQEMHVFGVWESQHIPDRPADDALWFRALARTPVGGGPVKVDRSEQRAML